MTAYYNENDPYAAQWLRNLIAAGHIAPGEVDERSILDVRADDLRGFTQCHFFAGIGVWSYALRLVGWPDDREVWTGSCPCQPFSAAGKRGGVEDERHLWPEFFRLINAVRPRAVFGEQVASKDGLAWLDIVSADLERAGYACGAVDTCAAGFGAPHIRQRLYFVADCAGERLEGQELQLRLSSEQLPTRTIPGFVADSSLERRQQISRSASGDEEAHGREPHGDHVASGVSAARSLADPSYEREHRSRHGGPGRRGEPSARGELGESDGGRRKARSVCESGHGEEGWPRSPAFEPGATNGFWRDADWLPCIDGKARPVEPGTFPLAHGSSQRVGRLRAYGNAINARQAAGFISAFLAPSEDDPPTA